MGSVSIIVLLFAGIIFAVIAIGIGRIFGNSSTNPEKGQPYECGIETQGTTTGYSLMLGIIYLPSYFLFSTSK